MTVKKTKTTKKIKNPWKLTAIPLHSWLIFWVLVLTTMALATVSFADAFKNGEGEVDQETVAAFEAIRKNLEDQVADLQSRAGMEVKTDGQLVASPFSEQQVGGCAQLKMSDLPPDQTIKFSDEKTGVSGSLPYNLSWGSETCFVTPFHMTTDLSVDKPVYLFGPVSINDIGGYTRAADLIITKTTSTPAQTLRDLRANPEVKNLRQRTINGITVISYEIQNEGPGGFARFWNAFGRSYYYMMGSFGGWLTDAEAVKIIQSLRVEN